MQKHDRFLRIHGDNIIECERSLNLIVQAYGASPILESTSLYAPSFRLETEEEILHIDLLSGHGRWGVDITDQIMKNGGVLREGADSYITEVIDNSEKILLAIEYCSALPAGNNAWQRNGRAYSSVLAGVPYLYFAEIGGVELNSDTREVKAPRFPNPVVPFSYIMTTNRFSTFCIPVYTPHPSITNHLYRIFQNIFGLQDSLRIIKGILSATDYSTELNSLKQKGIQMVVSLANLRKHKNTIMNKGWIELLINPDPATYINSAHRSLIWQKKITEKVQVSKTFPILFAKTMALGCYTIGAKDLPICLVPNHKLSLFKEILDELYPNLEFDIDWTNPLAIVWITGFKPKGDDSRPDRGLTPLARMVLGNSANILTVVSGPAKRATWNSFLRSTQKIAKDNGLWQSILNIANYVLIDSGTCPNCIFYKTNYRNQENPKPIIFPYKRIIPNFSEHDTDSAIHHLFSHKEELGIYESLCNPPGGDWSGISYFKSNGEEYRWTSLPRVSHIGGKRPDHVIQLISEDKTLFIIIESKQLGRNLEDNIGTNLIAYIDDLFSTSPIAYRDKENDWRLFSQSCLLLKPYDTLSVGAFIYTSSYELRTHLTRGRLDAIFAFEFGKDSILHILCTEKGLILLSLLEQIKHYVGCFKIQVH